ncbi:MAG: hypothetical protein COA86_06395 [Kangiella sp.]|nr:MAG: hypothetical protein COA86_06395 [Kangiella sp.]
MNNTLNKSSIRFVKRIYRPKIIGLLLALLAISASFYESNIHIGVWATLFFWCLVWPHLSYLLAIKSKNPSKREVTHLYIDAFIMGAWIPLMSFNFIPSLAILSMHILSIITLLGLRSALFALVIEFVGIFVSSLVFDFTFKMESEMYQVFACIPVLVIYPLLVGFTSHKLGLKVADKQAKLISLSRIDGLTGLNNRRYWENQLDRSFKLNKREESSTSVIFIDVDHFKKINDQYGHIVGDEVLQKISSLIEETARETDICGRYGGEEFCILLPKTGKLEAEILAERLREKVANTNLHSKLDIKGSISLGISELSGEMNSYSEWLTIADNALYKAKSNGRNQTVVATV